MSLSVAFVLLTVGLSMTEFEINGTRCGFSLLLVCMMTGTVFCNEMCIRDSGEGAEPVRLHRRCHAGLRRRQQNDPPRLGHADDGGLVVLIEQLLSLIHI